MEDEKTFADDFAELMDRLETRSVLDAAAERSKQSGEELHTDLHFGLQAATDEERDHIEWLRMKLIESLGDISSRCLRYEDATEKQRRALFNQCRWALLFRNSLRAARFKMMGQPYDSDFEPITEQKYANWVELCFGDVGTTKEIH